MDAPQFVLETEAGTSQILRATVTAVHVDGTVEISGHGVGPITCDMLRVANYSPLEPAVGDLVLAWHSGRTDERGAILGLIGPSHTTRVETAAPDVFDEEVPDELVIEAKHSLTLRVGAGSITIREDGKILIKGKDLVSHAQRLNRIKGGAVQIN